MPFAEYSSFEDCVKKNSDKADPEAYCAEIQRKVEGKKSHLNVKDYKFHFVTDSMEYGLKSDGVPYVVGIISTDELDSSDEIVAEAAIDDMIKQLKSRTIKLDLDHEKFRDPETGEIYEEPKNIIPIGKIISAEKVKSNGKTMIKIKAELNKASEKFKSIWKSIKKGFLDGFSIAYDVLDYAYESINGKVVTILKSILLKNVALTGDAVNKGCRIMEAFMKSSVKLRTVDDKIEQLSNRVKSLEDSIRNLKGGVTMAEEEKKENAPVEGQDEGKKEEPENKKEGKKKEETSGNEGGEGLKSLQKEIETLKSQLKEMADARKDDMETLKSVKEFLDSPKMKSIMKPSESKAPAHVEDITPLQVIA